MSATISALSSLLPVALPPPPPPRVASASSCRWLIPVTATGSSSLNCPSPERSIKAGEGAGAADTTIPPPTPECFCKTIY
jgi:hypothetical protein